MTHKEKALELYKQGFLCSQAVFAAFSEDCGMTPEMALRIGACFGSGMRKGEVCGSCSGGLMVLGALYGQDDTADPAARQRSNEVNDKMMDRFASALGSCLCRDLLGCDISTLEGVAYAREHRLFSEYCPETVAVAVDIVEEIIRETDTDR